jgi:hypothetical protein
MLLKELTAAEAPSGSFMRPLNDNNIIKMRGLSKTSVRFMNI